MQTVIDTEMGIAKFKAYDASE